VAIDVAGDRLLFGHVDPRRGWAIDHAIARAFDAGVDYTLKATLKGASVSVTVNGTMVGSWGYNAAVVDGEFGLLAQGGAGSFDHFRVPNDPAFAVPAERGGSAQASGETLSVGALQPVIDRRCGAGPSPSRSTIELAALQGSPSRSPTCRGWRWAAARRQRGAGRDAAGHGWFVDAAASTKSSRAAAASCGAASSEAAGASTC
jgi:hypothetical protein